jgi:D-alanyl-D-alanine carboxypeptidase
MGRRLSGLSVSICMAMALTTLAISPAEARKRYRSGGYHVSAPSNYAAYVVDANTGRTLYARNEDAIRHPASVTKVMTLYMLFEQLEKGRFRLDTPLRVSAHGASMAPSKLGLRPGETIEVEDAIKALVTKSANDVAATVAENIGGDESSFADMMTRKARSLGMRNTVYRNASGLPNPQQVTTARDLAILGRAIQERFPRYYHYFGTPAMRYGRQIIRNHHRQLGRVEGVDGIKTGYTRASGFNLLTSARRGGRHIVGVVLGGRTGRERDVIMAQLVNTQIAHASPVRGATQLASLRDEEEDAPALAAPQRMAAAEPTERPRMIAEEPAEPARRRLAPMALASAQTPMAAAAMAAAQAIKARPAVVTQDDDEGVTTASVQPQQRVIGARPAVIAAASTPSVLPPARRLAEKRVALVAPPSREALADLPAKRGKGAVKAEEDEDVRPARLAKVEKTEKGAKAEKTAKAEKPEKGSKAARKDKDVEETEVAKAESKADAKSRQVAAVRDTQRPSGWSIQIGATDNVEKANALLAKARGAVHLASAKSYTEKVQKGASTLYRARFAGLATDEAQTACKQLKRSGFACFATKD